MPVCYFISVIACQVWLHLKYHHVSDITFIIELLMDSCLRIRTDHLCETHTHIYDNYPEQLLRALLFLLVTSLLAQQSSNYITNKLKYIFFNRGTFQSTYVYQCGVYNCDTLYLLLYVYNIMYTT